MITEFESHYRYNQLKLASDLLSECNGSRILDVGCGNGSLEQYFSDYEVIGIDISLPALYSAKKNAQWSRYILADIRSLPIKEGCIDKVAMIAVLGGLPYGKEVIAFSEARRVLKGGGNLIILVSQQRQPYTLLTPDRLFRGWKWRHFDAQSIQRLLMENGFKINRIIFVGGILSLSLSLFHTFWSMFWGVATRRIIGRLFIPPLPYRFLNKIEKLEFNPFRGNLKNFARFFYIVAQKV